MIGWLDHCIPVYSNTGVSNKMDSDCMFSYLSNYNMFICYNFMLIVQ